MPAESRMSGTKIGAIGFLAIALAAGAFALFVLRNLLQEKGYGGERVKPVVVAKRALPAAEPITEDALQVMNWPESAVPPGSFSETKALFASGKPPIPSTGILPGEPVVASRLATSSQGTGLAALVRPNYRAVAVKTNDAVGRSGLVYPGAYVDVLSTMRDSMGRGSSTRIAVEDARVLAVEHDTDVATRRPPRADSEGSMSSSDPMNDTVVTIELTPEQAEIVSLAFREGNVDLALRNAGDHAPGGTKGVTPDILSAFPTDEELAAEAASAAAAAVEAAGKSKGSGRKSIILEGKSPRGDSPGRIESVRVR